MYDRSRQQRPRQFYSPEDFFAEARKYFEWCDDNPLKEEQVWQFKGGIVRADKAKVRPYTKKGLAIFLHIPSGRLASYSARGEGWSDTVEMIDEIIYTQKFENAAAGLLQSTFIARDLGLAEKQEVTGANGGPIELGISTRERIAGRIASLAERLSPAGDTGGAE